MSDDFSTLDTICLKCGDRGFTNAFVYCVKCLNFAVHRYCLDVIPETLDELVKWFCDDCDDASRCLTIDQTPSEHVLAVKTKGPVYEDVQRPSNDASRKLGSDERCSPEGAKVENNLTRRGKLLVDSGSMKKKRSTIMVSTVGTSQRRFGNNSSKRPREQCSNPEAYTVEDRSLSCDVSFRNSKKKKIVVPSEANLKDRRHETLFAKNVEEKKCVNSENQPSDVKTEEVELRSLSCDVSFRNSKKKENVVSSEANFEDRRYGTLFAENVEEKKCLDLENQPSDVRTEEVEDRSLSCDVSFRNLEKKEIVVFSEANLEDRRHETLFAKNAEEKKCLNSENQPSDMRTEEVVIEPTTNLNENRESVVREDKISTSQHVSNFPEAFTKYPNISSVLDCHRCVEPSQHMSNLSCEVSFRNSKNKKSVASSEANLEDRRHETLFAKNVEEKKCLDSENQPSDMRTEEVVIEPTTNLNENRESVVREDKISTSQHVSNFSEAFTEYPNISSVLDCHKCAEPVTTPIWRGSFIIWNKYDDTIDGLVAHMSSIACQKVYEQACQFQPLLHLEMLPRSDVWPKSFETSDPSENIALYFFPSDMRSERGFDALVDIMVHKELAMRTVMQNAELLVFPSTKLPLLHWRFQGKYYLWGVFRKKKHPTLRSQSCQEELNHNPILIVDPPNDTSFNGEIMSKCSSLPNILDENRLKGPNHVDWEQNLAPINNLIHVLNETPPKLLVNDATQDVQDVDCSTRQSATNGFMSCKTFEATYTHDCVMKKNVYVNESETVGESQKFDSSKRNRNFGNKKNGKVFRKQVRKEQSENSCYYCGERGHWRRNCHLYISSYKKDKVSQGHNRIGKGSKHKRFKGHQHGFNFQ